MKVFVQKSPIDHPQFSTHKNYLSYMRRASHGLTLNCNNNITAKLSISENTLKKVKLVKLTVGNMRTEYQTIIRDYPDYAAVYVSWIPVKSYYVIFNLIVILEYLLSGNEKVLTTSHSNASNTLKNLLTKKEVEFTLDEFNEVTSVADIEKMKVPRFENLKTGVEYRKAQIFRKLADYSRDELKRRSKSKRLSKADMERFRKSNLSLFEFFYWYRIKVNYRDLEFISDEVTPEEFQQFYEDYFLLTVNFYKAFKNCINELSQKRAGVDLL